MRLVEKTASCWNWLGCSDVNGYGRFRLKDTNGKSRSALAHRVSWIAAKGQISDLFPDIDHRCRNPRCINPEHLQPVTRRENIRRSDFTAKTATADAQTNCAKGHAYEGNTYWYRGKRKCARCRQIQMRAYNDRLYGKDKAKDML